MKTRGIIFSALALLMTVFFAGCEEFTGNNSDQDGKLIIKVTDAPFPIDLIEEANVTITKVEIRLAEDTTTVGTDSTGYPFLTVFEGAEKYNLMELRNGITADLAEIDIPAGMPDLPSAWNPS